MIFLILLLLAGCSSAPKVPTFDKPKPKMDLSIILDTAAKSKCAAYSWSDRGRAPMGFIKGMALSYARAVCGFKQKDPVAMLIARPRGLPEAEADKSDAISWYNSNFKRLGMSNDELSLKTLRHVYMLGIGLGMRESSGNYSEGRDTTAKNTSASTAEAGMFQTSWNAAQSHPLLSKVFESYQANPSRCLLSTYKEGVRYKSTSTYGSGAGAQFQDLAKSCPAFAAEFAMVTLRTTSGRAPYGHYGPIRRKEAELNPSCNDMLFEVEELVGNNPEICSQL